MVKNRNFGQKSKFCQKSKIKILVGNLNFGRKSKFWSKIKILVENQHFSRKSKFWSKILKIRSSAAYGKPFRPWPGVVGGNRLPDLGIVWKLRLCSSQNIETRAYSVRLIRAQIPTADRFFSYRNHNRQWQWWLAGGPDRDTFSLYTLSGSHTQNRPRLRLLSNTDRNQNVGPRLFQRRWGRLRIELKTYIVYNL